MLGLHRWWRNPRHAIESSVLNQGHLLVLLNGTTNTINEKKEVCDPPIGTMEREYEVAITIFSIVQEFPQINQTAGENTQWGGSDLVGGGS